MTPQTSNNSLNFTHVFFHTSTFCMAMFVLSVFQYPTACIQASFQTWSLPSTMTARFRSVQPCDPWHPMRRCAQRLSGDGSSAQGESSHESSNKHGANGFEFYDYSPQNERTSPEKERLECGWKTTFLLKLPLF